jgi:hypothetical protein
MSLGTIVDRFGDANPQLFRELKERLTLRNLGIAIVASLLVQGLTLLYFNGQVPVAMSASALLELNGQSPVAVPEAVSIENVDSVDRPIEEHYDLSTNDDTYSKYCQSSPKAARIDRCRLDSTGNFQINWQIWRSNVFNCLSWILSIGLILGSVYLLVADLVREEKRGTLNFLRLSPQSAQKIFIGKILGVPILVYLAAALMLPLHASLGLSIGSSVPVLMSWYVTIVATWWLFASTAVLYTILGGGQAIVTTIATGVPLWLTLLITNAYVEGIVNRDLLYWFGVNINRSAIWIYVFVTGCCSIASYWVWQALTRRYLNPTATAISKQQSYLINLCLQLWIGGFALPLMFADPSRYWATRQMLSWLALVDFLALLLSIALLLPSKQALQDWSRHRRERTQMGRKFWQRDLVRDLIGNDKSPALLTIAINVGMAMAVWLPVSLLVKIEIPQMDMKFDEWSAPNIQLKLAAAVCIAAALMLIYATIAHLGLFLKVKQRNFWTVAIVGSLTILPLVGAFALSPARVPTGLAAIFILFSPFAPIGLCQLSLGTIFASFVAQLGVFATLARQLQRQLQISGRSQSQELLTRS